MKFKFMSLAAMAACVALASCSNEDEPSANVDGVKALTQVSVGIKTQNSRAGITAGSFSGTESLGLFLFGGEGIDDATDGRYNVGSTAALVEPLNVKYTRGTEGTVGDGNFNEYFVSANPIILSSKPGKLYTYYPWADGNADGKAIPVKVATNQGTGISDGTADVAEQTDYMYGTAISNVSNATEHVDIVMNHALAMVSFKFVRNTYPGDGVIERIELRNGVGKSYLLSGDATMHIGTGALNLDAAVSDKEIYCLPAVSLVDLTASKEIPHMLVYPQTEEIAAGDVILSIKMDGKTYELNLPTELKAGAKYAWTKGNNYLYTLNMNGYGFGADDEDGRKNIDVTITPWLDNETSAGEMNKPLKN